MRSGWVGSRWPASCKWWRHEKRITSLQQNLNVISCWPSVRHTLISELFFSLLDMGTKGLLGSKLKPVRSSWPYENGSWIILDHQGEAVRLSEDVLTKEFHGLLIHLGLGSPNSRFRHGAPALHCSLQGRQTPGIAQASPTLAHPLEPRSRSLGCTSEAYLQQISSLAFSRAGPRHHNGGIPACALFTWLDTPHAAAAALLITSPLQGNSSLCLRHLYGAVAEQRPPFRLGVWSSKWWWSQR